MVFKRFAALAFGLMVVAGGAFPELACCSKPDSVTTSSFWGWGGGKKGNDGGGIGWLGFI